MNEKELTDKVNYWLHRFDKSFIKEDIEEARYLLEHDEWEIAFEILLINLINSELVISDDEANELEDIAVQCNLKEQGGVSDYYIWRKFLDWKKVRSKHQFPIEPP